MGMHRRMVHGWKTPWREYVGKDARCLACVHTTLLASPTPLSSNVGSPYGSAPDVERTGSSPSTMEEKINEIYFQQPLFLQNASKIENCVQTLSQTVADQTTTNIERNVSSRKARVATLETSAASASSGSGSSSSWNLLGQSDGSTATGSLGSHGPGSSDDNRNTRRRLDTFSSPEDEHARRAVLLHFRWSFCVESKHLGNGQHTRLQQIHQNSLQNRWPIRQTRIRDESLINVKTLWPDTRMMDGISHEVDSPFCNVRTNIAVRL